MFLKPIDNIISGQFTYALPDERIAAYPVSRRDDSQLLIRRKQGTLERDTFGNLASYLEKDCHMVFNNSRVIPARLIFKKPSGSRIELFCLKPVEPAGYAASLSSGKECTWECMAGNLKRFRENTLSLKVRVNNEDCTLKAEKIRHLGNTTEVRFTWDNGSVTFAGLLSAAGQTPLPPYIKRNPEEIDRSRYQTIYSRVEGSVAAPTAGLHFTEAVFEQIRAKNISVHEVTLHIGAGTFQPIKTPSVLDHEMHAEFFSVSGSLIAELEKLDSGIVAVGTTTVRTIESLYWLGVKILQANKNSRQTGLHLGQWEAYCLPQEVPVKQAFVALNQWLEKWGGPDFAASTKLMIVPGYKFRVVNTLITNFHQPGSTLLLLVAAFMGEQWKETYQYALDNGFRFLSYGDSSILFA
ncbi:MAG TPA: S-adenosylmethionine:tRNA ribosyltransferase-isomerase [Bacteroidales bacterium]|nr:S-adenosylmethionine:tRNA ribosyltransferase-isomerase [Bacteroidales bacterium]